MNGGYDTADKRWRGKKEAMGTRGKDDKWNEMGGKKGRKMTRGGINEEMVKKWMLGMAGQTTNGGERKRIDEVCT